MALDYDTQPGGLFRQLGQLFALMRTVNAARNDVAPDPDATWGALGPTIKDLQTGLDDIADQYDDSVFDEVVDGLNADAASHRLAQKAFLSRLQTYARNTVIEHVHSQYPLSTKNIANAIAELARRMDLDTETVNGSTVSATSTAAGTNEGDGVAAVTVKNKYGDDSQYLFNESIILECNNDSQLTGTEGRETFTVTGAAAESDTLSQDWPAGSAASGSLTALDAASTTSNLLTNGSFNTFTVANTPTSWTIQVGAAATDIFEAGNTDDYDGDNALEFTGTGGQPLSQIWQALTTLKPNTVYAYCYRAKRSTSLAAGVLSIDLHNGTSVIADDASTSNSTTKAYSALTTSYQAFTGFFITPNVLPSTVRLRVHISTALTSGESLFVDHLCLAAATQLYTGGVYAAIFSGATNFAKYDRFTLAVSSTLGVFQEYFERCFGMRTLGYQLPYDGAGTESNPDSYIS
jgi:hypothetical protein